MSLLRVLFYGTSSFAVPTLEHLVDDPRIKVVGVVTQPDKPVGRHAEHAFSPIKQAALAYHLPLKQYPSVKDPMVCDELSVFEPDVAVVVSFGQIIPDTLLSLPEHGSINIHGSLLPRYRGASPIHAAILNGDRQTGITIMKMDAKMDHGPLLASFSEPIDEEETTQHLHDRLANLAGIKIVDVLLEYVNGSLTPTIQDESQATYVKLLSREDGWMNWQKPAQQIVRQIRAYDPWPGTFCCLDDQRIKVFHAETIPLPDNHAHAMPGTTFIYDGRPAVVCGSGTALCLLRVQPEGKKIMEGQDFLRGKADWKQKIMSSEIPASSPAS